MGYEFQIKYKAESLNKAADALSRRGDTTLNSISSISIPQWDSIDEIKEAVQKDPVLSKIITRLNKGELPDSPYSMTHGTLLYKGKLVPALGIKMDTTDNGGVP
ncbi:hypothetical protein F511_06602 [Dorcoceras hygrometricum]|uniref:Uncharacterized protein n=1 Tax=Dorcoceras hygrometricum TaxID=472368 RepID=A0A2Z7B6A0_9LAMI|nr:hypothetical protein F511_06602 [Dorcoceras hygrometricum]